MADHNPVMLGQSSYFQRLLIEANERMRAQDDKEELSRHIDHCVRNSVCVKCDNYLVTFRTPIEAARYRQTGLCQDCQDEILD
jgi:hypothetical protein